MAREIVGSVLAQGLRTEQGPDVDQLQNLGDVLPGRLNAQQARLLVVCEDEGLLKILNREYDATRFSAAGDRSGRTKTERRVRDLPIAPVSTDKALHFRKQIDRQMELIQEQSRQGQLPPIPADVLPVISNLASEFHGRMAEIGPQAALLERLPVVRFTKTEQLKLTTDELVIQWVFENQVRSVAGEFLNASECEQETLARTLDFADCPGSWLRWRLRRCVRGGSHEPRPNHHFDAERLAYLPYVDLLLTDGEMAEFVRQIKDDKSTPARIRDLRPPLSIATSMDALEGALETFAND